MSEPLWNVQDVANWAGVSYNAAYKSLTRLREKHGLTHAEYGRAGALLYHPDAVRAAWPLLPGSGTWKRGQGDRTSQSGTET